MGVLPFVYAAALVTKGGPLCRQSWNNKAKNRPIDRLHLALSLHQQQDEQLWAKKVRSFLAAQTLIYPVSTVQLNRSICRHCMIIWGSPQLLTYHSVLGKRPWALKYTLRFWPAWVLTWDIISIRLYRSCYIDPLKWGTWALVRDTMVEAHGDMA